jgi:transposase
METTTRIQTERVDDFVLLIEMLKQAGLAEIVDRHIPRHGLQQGLSWGWVTVVWLSHIVSQGDHRKVTVRDWAAQAHETLERCTGLDIRDTDFTDDRLSIVLRELSKPAAWQAIEKDLGERIMRVYDLEAKRVRLDATTVSGCHEGGDGRLFQFGNSKDDPTLRQVKVMMSALDPLGMPLTTSVVSGERADDGLYAPSIDRMDRMVGAKGLLFVGDCKMSSLATRAHVHRLGHHYLAPLALVGETGREMPAWIDEAVSGLHALTPVYAKVDGGEPKLLGRGYERTRSCTAREDAETICWEERIFVFNSKDYAKARERGLEQRLSTACAKLNALTPAPGRGKRQVREEEQLVQAAQAILSAHGVEGLVAYSFERREEIEIRYVGRGRGGIERPRRAVSKVRYEITSVERREEAIAALKKTLGWRAYATDCGEEGLSLEEAVLAYRNEWLVERGFHRLKGAPLSLDPVFVKRDDQIAGLINLLGIALRLLTLIEFVSLRQGCMI